MVRVWALTGDRGRADLGPGRSLASIAVLAAAVGIAAGVGKLKFDGMVQRDAPDAVQGRTFGRFATRSQLVWVLGRGIAPSSSLATAAAIASRPTSTP